MHRNLDTCFATFPRLAERRSQLAGSLSGGEQQMLALGRALMLAPKILLVDEPSVGLAPLLVSRTIDAIKELKDQYQLTVLMAEQNFTQAIRIADRGYVIVHGKIAVEGRSARRAQQQRPDPEVLPGALSELSIPDFQRHAGRIRTRAICFDRARCPVLGRTLAHRGPG